MSQITEYHDKWTEKQKGQYFRTYKVHEYFPNRAVLLSKPHYDAQGILEGGVIEFTHEDEVIVQRYLKNLPEGNYAIKVVPMEFYFLEKHFL